MQSCPRSGRVGVEPQLWLMTRSFVNCALVCYSWGTPSDERPGLNRSHPVVLFSIQYNGLFHLNTNTLVWSVCWHVTFFVGCVWRLKWSTLCPLLQDFRKSIAFWRIPTQASLFVVVITQCKLCSCTLYIKIQRVTQRQRSVIPLERPVSQSCIGKWGMLIVWILQNTQIHYVGVTCRIISVKPGGVCIIQLIELI
jgi:hypothetical protein